MSIYTASNAAVNAWTDGMTIKVKPFGIRVRVVLSVRAPSTRLVDNAQPRMPGAIPPPPNLK